MNHSQGFTKTQRLLQAMLVSIRPMIPYLQGCMLVALAAMLVLPLFGSAPRFQWQTPWNNAQLFSEWLLWGVWYPATLLSVLVLGRFWCGVLCPLGAVSEWVGRVGAQFNPPRWVKHPIAPAFSFLIVTIWAQTLDVRDDLHAALLLFTIIFVLATACGLLFAGKSGTNRRIWCRHLCPIGSVLGVFSRLGITSLEPKNAHRASATEGYRDHGLCPTSIDLRSKQSARHCIKCARCIKPHSRGGLSIAIRPPAEEIIHIERRSPCASELAFIWFAPGLAISGFVWSSSSLYMLFRQALGEWAMQHQWMMMFQTGPAWLMNQNVSIDQHYMWLDFVSISAFMLGLSVAMATVLAGISALGALTFHSPHLPYFHQRVVAFGYQFAPLAMICIVLGLGSTMFATLQHALGSWVMDIEVGLIVVAIAFNVSTATRWLNRQSSSKVHRIAAHGLMLAGGAVIAAASLWSVFPSVSF